MTQAQANPKVSVITPTYKRSQFLPRAIESILAQTYQNLELLIVDDNLPGSPEQLETQRVRAPYLRDARVTGLQPGGARGGGAARNLALRACTGDYIAFLDDDDRFLPTKIEAQLAYAQAHELELCFQDVQWFNEQEQLVEYRRLDRVKEFTREGLLHAHLLHSLGPTSIYLVRREAALRTQGFGEVRRGQDFIFMLRCIEAGLKIGYMPGAYVVQYLHAGERISVGSALVDSQTELYRLIQTYAPILSRRERRYVDFRYNCVCAFATARGKQPLKALPFALRALVISPVDSLREAWRYLHKQRPAQPPAQGEQPGA